MASRSQMLKGLLEGCILEIISHGETYGYEITENLNRSGFADLNEGSVYPVLIRLQNKDLVTSKSKESPLGPRRKYFYITDKGLGFLDSFKREWQEISGVVTTILKGGA
ncbi:MULTISPECIES: PadR family transcriptional regulator [unclassified Fusibacter]|uniref:PadR family transcriptional regulator n=1 Tax=unclassified Fusibacter TaxID=2624464 RepID=UPI0010110637|nr:MULTISPECIES: PadR family transcriptional regulator [unclassified Fusibacter]MCK8060173.1 PadR family transcriptional regulator [Fusibacter sp. A2]NPE22313.1 PadR family transcriptional regulator [Fusibacter sp. A1]RXV61086.1 PadR family transcriptional regulator [Fusibacter sp. A1]